MSGFMRGLGLCLAWLAGLGVLAGAAWASVGLGFLPAVLFGLAAGLLLRAAWRRTRGPGRDLVPAEGGGERTASSERAVRRLGSRPPSPPPPGRPRPESAPARAPRSGLPWILSAVGVLAVVALFLVFAGEVVDRIVDPAPPLPPAGIGSIYRAAVEPGPERGTLIVRERYAVAVADVESPDAFRPAEGRYPVPEGWEGTLARDSVILMRERTEPVDVSLLRPTSVVALHVPPVRYDGPVLWARPGSRAELDLPRHPGGQLPPVRVHRGSPRPAGARADGDSAHDRRRRPPRASPPAPPPGTPPPRGGGPAQASLLAPVKWAALALVAIFAEQIKARMLVPLARRIADGLRIPLFEGGRGGAG